jgi:hypothetical protein
LRQAYDYWQDQPGSYSFFPTYATEGPRIHTPLAVAPRLCWLPPARVLCPTHHCAPTHSGVFPLPLKRRPPPRQRRADIQPPPPRSGWPCIRPPRRRPRPVRRGRPRRWTTNPQVPFATAIGASRFNPPRGTRLNSAHLVHGSGPYRPPDPRGPPVPPFFRSGPGLPSLVIKGTPKFQSS